MKKLIARLKADHWDTLSATEQKTVKRGAWVLVPLLMYGLLWQPAHEALPKLQAHTVTRVPAAEQVPA